MASDETTGGSSVAGDDERQARIARIVAECSNRLNGGEEVDVAGIVRDHPELSPELGLALEGFGDVRRAFRTDEAPRAIGDYQVLRELGRGGMGIVYEALQVPLNRRVALKVLPRELVSSERALERFRHEAKVASRLSHPGICTVYEAGVEDGVPHIAMQYVEGQTLASMISARRERAKASPWDRTEGVGREARGDADSERRAAVDGKVSSGVQKGELAQVVALGEKVARALHAAHEAGLVHRDVKPGNIMVTPAGEPVILDFGLAQEEESRKRLTISGELVGTPAYMSPEQIAASRIQVDRRTDVYSLGVTLYETLTGRLPFDAPTRDGIFRQILGSEPPDPRNLNRHISRDLKVVLETALEKDLNRRYGTAQALAEDLRRVREREPILARPAGPVVKLGRWAQRNPVVATATAAAFVLLATGLTIALVLLDRVDRERRAAKAEREARTAALAEKSQALEQKALALGEKQSALAAAETARDAAKADRDAKEAALADRTKALREKEDAFAREQGQRIAAQALQAKKRNPQLALLLALEGRKLSPGAFADSALLSCLEDLREHQVLEGHRGPVQSAVFSSDGKLVLTASADASARIWDAKSGKEMHVLRRHYGGCVDARFSPDGSLVATAGRNLTASIWETATGREIRTLITHGRNAGPVDWSPDGRRVATTSGGTTAQVWDVPTGGVVADLKGHAQSVTCARFSPDGRLVATASADDTVRLWDAETGKEMAVLRGQKGDVAFQFSPDGKLLASWSEDGKARLWDVAGGTELQSLDHGTPLNFSTFRPDGTQLLTGSDDGLARIWDVQEKALAATLAGHGAAVHAGAYSLDGRWVATGSADGIVKIWDARSASEMATLRGHEAAIVRLSFAPDGSQLLTVSQDGTARLWPIPPRGDVIHGTPQGRNFSVDGVSPDGRWVAGTRWGGGLKIFDAETGWELVAVEGAHPETYTAEFSPDGRLLATEFDSEDGTTTTCIWDTSTWRRLVALEGHTWYRFSPDGSRILTVVYSERTACISDARSGKQVIALRGDGFGFTGGAEFSPDGERVIACCDDNAARIWDARSGRILGVLKSRGLLAKLAPIFSPDGTRVLTTQMDGTAEIWDAATGEERLLLETGRDGFVIAQLSRDGRWVLLSDSRDSQTLRDAATGESPKALNDVLGRMTRARFSPDGRRVLASSRDGDLHVLEVPSGRETLCLWEGKYERRSFFLCSRDGKKVFRSSEDGTWRIWTVDDLETVALKYKKRELVFEERDSYEIGTTDERRALRVKAAVQACVRELESGTGPRDSLEIQVLSAYPLRRAASKLQDLAALLDPAFKGNKPPYWTTSWLLDLEAQGQRPP